MKMKTTATTATMVQQSGSEGIPGNEDISGIIQDVRYVILTFGVRNM